MFHKFEFEPTPIVQTLLEPGRLPELGPGKPNEAVREQLEKLSIELLFAGQLVRDAEMAKCCVAGLWLHHDFLDESHTISQEISTVEGSYWHGIMHRREPDADNAKYWFRRVGAHPVIEKLPEMTRPLDYEYRSPFDFIDFCERVRGSGSMEKKTAEIVQFLEWMLLFEHCWNSALGSSRGT
jgi:hypothetical protein